MSKEANNNNDHSLLVEETTKYDLPLHIREKTASYKQLIPTCSTLKLGDSQSKFKFGFIPLGDLSLPAEVNPTDSIEDPIALHTIKTASGRLNFMSKQINLTSQLKSDIWEQELIDYWDNQLTSLIRFGFPLDFLGWHLGAS